MNEMVTNPTTWIVLGIIVNVFLSGMGSARGLRTASVQTTGVMSERPELFGKLFVLTVLPGTQGFYGFIASFLAGSQTLMAGNIPSMGNALALMFLLVGMGVVCYFSAVDQGRTSAAAINMVAKQEQTFGQAIIMPALVETYAVLGLLLTIILMGVIVS
ncbi:MAG: V-type ATP synthase subunit K [Caldisericia bacterium]|nr:V-type ATP synthase subunit K [Caldisericia bacterium]